MNITPKDYADIFEGSPQGQLILEDLVSRFGGSVYVKGGADAARQTDFNCGKRAVLDFILARISQAQEGYKDVEETDESVHE